MKFKSIIAILSFFMIAVSCSMEDQVMDDISKEIEAGTDQVVSLSFNLGTDYIATKSFETSYEQAEGDKEKKVNNCLLILTDGNQNGSKVVATANATGEQLVASGDGWKANVRMLIKAKDNLYITAIANADYNLFSSCSTLGALNAKVLTLAQTDPYLVKCSHPKAVTIPATHTFTSTTEALANPLEVPITLTQLAAKFELKAFSVVYTGTGTVEPAVTLQKIELRQAKKLSFLFAEMPSDTQDVYATGLFREEATGIDYLKGETLFSSYLYRNEDATDKTTVALTFRIDENVPVTRLYTIKTPNGNNAFSETVLPGYLYRMKINLSVDRMTNKFDVNLQYSAVPFAEETVVIPDFE